MQRREGPAPGRNRCQREPPHGIRRGAARRGGIGHVHRLHDRRRDAFHGRRIGQQRAPFAAVDQPADRALEVQVDGVEPLLFDDPGRLGHQARVGPANLPDARRLGPVGVEQPQGPAIAGRHVGRIHAFRANERRPVPLHL